MKVSWSSSAELQSMLIGLYLRTNFSHKEVDHYLEQLSQFEQVVSVFPMAFPKFGDRRRKAVLNKNLSIVYEIGTNSILVVSVMDNRQGPVVT